MVSIFVLLAFCLPIYLALAILKVQERKAQQRLNPLTKGIFRPAGYSLYTQIDELRLDVMAKVAVIVFLPPTYFSAMSSSDVLVDTPSPLWAWVVTGLIMIMAECVFIKKLINNFSQLRNLRLGHDCEITVGQQLDQLMLQGYRVYHDIQAGDFNIDHLVIGESGVYAVETKGRSKLEIDDKKQFKVFLSGKTLTFPNGKDTESIKQAERQAQWVSAWLSKASGVTITAQPVVIVPGWFVEMKKRPEVPVLALGRGITGYFGRRSPQVLNEPQIQQLVYQIEQKAEIHLEEERLKRA